ncbi:MAG: TatD family hydrolase [Chitinispirillales bacterium]|nr:TatD family hydrolase [Chitinispirillales bacterium]
MWVDTHAHLASVSYDEFMQKIIAAKTAGVVGVINVATNIDEAKIAVERTFSETPIKTFAVIGVCVPESENFYEDEDWIETLENLALSENVVAIGETGMDGSQKSDYPPLDKQAVVFDKQIALSKKINKPLVVHSRMLDEKVLEICVSQGMKDVLFHCFTGSAQMAKKITDNGYFISFSGITTFKNSGLDETIKAVPIERILVETDSPWLAPSPFRGKPNEPAFVRFVGEKVSQIYGINKEKFAEIIQQNAENFFAVSF